MRSHPLAAMLAVLVTLCATLVAPAIAHAASLPEVTATLSRDPGEPRTGQPLHFTAVVANSGGTDALSVDAVFSLDPTYSEAVGVPDQGSCDPPTAGFDLHCPLGTIAAGGQVSVAFTAVPTTQLLTYLSLVAYPSNAAQSPLQTVNTLVGAPATPPDPPATAAVVGATTSATVSWSAPATDGGLSISGYSVTVTPGATVVDAPSWATSTTVTGLTAGVTYSFAVRAKNALGSGDPVTVTAHGTVVTAKVARSSVTYGGSTTFGGTIRTVTGNAVGGASVRIQARSAGASGFSTIATVETSAHGAFSRSVRPTRTTTYRATFAGGTGLMARSSTTRTVAVAPKVSIVLDDSTAARGQTVHFTGSVSPNARRRSVHLQVYASGRWSTVASKRLSSASRYSFAWRPHDGADHRFRVVVPARAGYAAGRSARRTLHVA